MEKKKQSKRTITPEIICQRKLELIKRDPLAIELDELARGIAKDTLTWREIKKRFPNYDGIEIQEHGLTGILEKELQRKWNVNCYPTSKANANIPFSWLGLYPSHPTVSDVRVHINEYLIPAIKEDIKFKRAEKAGKGDIDFSKNLRWDEQGILRGMGAYDALFPNRVYIPIPKGSIPILIDIGGLSKKSKDDITEQVWNIVKQTIEKRRIKKSEQLPQIGDPPELKFIYTMKDDVFKKHLKWYDLHTTEKLSFRLIAHIDNIFKTNPQKASEILKELRSRRVKWGLPIRGENNIEKGVNLICRTIRRTDDSQKEADQLKVEPLIEKYICPTHKDNNCPVSCEYSKEWLGRFNRLMPSS